MPRFKPAFATNSDSRVLDPFSWAGARFDQAFMQGLIHIFRRQRLPYLSSRELSSSLDVLASYNQPEFFHNPDLVFAPRSKVDEWTTISQKAEMGGTFSHFIFKTPYHPFHYAYEREFKRYLENHTVHVYAWRHRKQASGTVLINHGWAFGQPWIHAQEFGIPYLFRELGLDVFFFVAPYHWRRKPHQVAYGGELYPSSNLMRTNEAFIQAIQELRTIIGLIQRDNPAPIGAMGSSLGGYTSALLASVDDRLSFVVPVLPPSQISDLFWEHGHTHPVFQHAKTIGINQQRLREAWAINSPLNYRPKVDWDGRMIVSASGDSIVHKHHIERLWRHWGYPKSFEFSGGHVLQFGRKSYHREVGKFLQNLGVVESH